ncbi:MAG TPA: Wadjet anti-phage system protein JetD domain-containing protein [Steroidobacteraceae bacterium]
MMWQTPEERLVLLELLVRGSLKRRRAQTVAYDALAELPWTRATGRRDEIALVEERRPELVALIDRVWAGWGEALTDLTARGLPPTPEGWGKLEDARRAEGLPTLPEQLNRRTAAALAAPHSKAALTERRLAALGDTGATHDGSVRLRPPRGLVARTRRAVADLTAVAEVLGEVAIPERAFKEGLTFEGTIRAVLLVENLGAWRDLFALEGWLFAHVPGWDTATVVQLLDRVGQVPVIHFGDLDPNGVRIFLHLRKRCPDLRWFVPSFWRELVESKGLRASWSADLDLRDAPELVRELAHRGLWLEQEPLVVDDRITNALEAML